jgi:hypothetical protein
MTMKKINKPFEGLPDEPQEATTPESLLETMYPGLASGSLKALNTMTCSLRARISSMRVRVLAILGM